MASAANLRSPEAMSLVAQSICTLVEGELLQSGDTTMHDLHGDTIIDMEVPVAAFQVQVPPGDDILTSLWEEYLHKTYMKTASLFVNALQAAVILGGVDRHERWMTVATSYGEWLGMAFQVCHKLILDFPIAS